MRSRCWGRPPLQLADGLHLVASGRLGLSLSHPLDCHTYLVAAEKDAILIDAGCGRGQDSVLAAIDASGVPRDRISKILLTHAHADHSGGAAGLARALGAEILASPEVTSMLAGPDEDAIGLTRARIGGTYPTDFKVPPTSAVAISGSFVRAGDLVVDVLETPGHARGHLAFLVDLAGARILFSGDLVFARGRVVVLGTEDSDPAALARSIGEAARARPETLLAGHGELVMSDAGAHIGTAIECFRRGQLPPSLL